MNRCDWLDQSGLRGNRKTRTELGLNTGTTLDGMTGAVRRTVLRFELGGGG